VTSPADDPLPEDVETLKAMLLAERSARRTAEAQAHERALQIEKLKHTIAKLRHERFGQSAERRALLDQLELQLVELEEDQAQSETAGEIAVETVTVQPFHRRKPARRPLPEHLPRERVLYPVPSACPCCGGGLRKLGEDVTETLKLVPRQVEGDPARAREVLVPGLRDDHPAARAVAPDRARARRSGPAGACAVCEVRPAPAAHPPERNLCPRGRRARRLDLG